MKKIKFYYANLPNMGDLLNPLIVKKIYGIDSERHTYLTCELSSIGSGLGQFTFRGGVKEKVAKGLASLFIKRKVYVWGTGFINYNKGEKERFFRKNMEFCAVRGELSKKRVEKILNRKLNIPTGDVGILADRLIEKDIEKKYKVGIIPHFKEQDHPIFKELLEDNENSIIIDLKEDPIAVIRRISECEVIISSSLHGLIVADSFGIPNHHIVVTNNLLGDGFKFDDYYSAYNLEHEYTDVNKESVPEIEEIIHNYKITKEMINEKKKLLIDSFPFKKI